jgi:hypothetical protein
VASNARVSKSSSEKRGGRAARDLHGRFEPSAHLRRAGARPYRAINDNFGLRLRPYLQQFFVVERLIRCGLTYSSSVPIAAGPC